MHPRRIERFFRTLDREFGRPATIVLTGAAAGSLLGRIRPSQDIDFSVALASRSPEVWEAFQAAVERAVRETGIQANYAEDIDRWSAITLLDYRRHTVRWRRIGQVTVRVLDPVYWSIGKVGRYLELDVEDLVAVLRRTRTPLARLLAVWARALRASPRSTAVTQFRRQAEHFLRSYGRTVWGRRFDADGAVRRFHQAAGVRVGGTFGR